MLDGYLGKVCVIGAGGRMGRGIALLLLVEISRNPENKTLLLIDTNPKALDLLKRYLKYHFQKKGISWDIAEKIVRFSEDLTEGKDCKLVFEAITEDVEAKAHAFRTLAAESTHNSFYFTETSSIPIHELAERAKLNNRLIGAHFYNPPLLQNLLEVISPEGGDPQLIKMTEELATRLGKTVVFSKDVAGFIGNGHFIRELQYACKEVHRGEHPLPEAITALNYVTQNFLIRPMGIFQLIDFMGVEVCALTGHIMANYQEEKTFVDPLLDRMIAEGAIGGVWEDGSQKDGFFRYEKSVPVAVYSLEERAYIPLPDISRLGDPPKGHFSWKALRKNSQASSILSPYVENLMEDPSLGGKIAQEYLIQSTKIAQLLVDKGIAKDLQDVDTVLRLGFNHLITPLSFQPQIAKQGKF